MGVGCIVDSCMGCDGCKAGEEHMCSKGGWWWWVWCDYNANSLIIGMTGTYNGDIKHGHIATDSGWTYGGYSGSQTVHQK